MGRRLCANDNNHPNNIYINAIIPAEKNGNSVCRVCGGTLSARSDDQDESAIDKRHNIYYDMKSGTMAAVEYFKEISKVNNGIPVVIELDGLPGVKDVSKDLISRLK